jgi:CRISPR-associated protein Csb1
MNKFDPSSWLTDNDVVAVVLRQYLRPVDGYDSPIFPPTFAMKPSLQRHPYNIDQLSNGHNICLIDSVASQSNRIEPIFDAFSPRLVPRVTVKVKSGKHEEAKSLLEIGHRVADAVVRFSDWAATVSSALSSYAATDSVKRDALPLAEIAPTSLVFGAWSSRDAGEKVPRLVQSTIRATNVDVLTRASQYVPPFEYKQLVDEKGTTVIDPKMKDKKLSGQGLLAVPVVTMPTKEKNKDLAFRVHGGVIVNGDIRRDASINLINLRGLSTADKLKKDTLRPYLLGLSLVAFLYEQDFNLRQGCLLVLDPQRSEQRKSELKTNYGKYPLALVRRDGTEEDLNLSFAEVLDYAKDIAKKFIVNQDEIIVNFKPNMMKTALKDAPEDTEGTEE